MYCAVAVVYCRRCRWVFGTKATAIDSLSDETKFVPCRDAWPQEQGQAGQDVAQALDLKLWLSLASEGGNAKLIIQSYVIHVIQNIGVSR